jgi:hypothetical protein
MNHLRLLGLACGFALAVAPVQGQVVPAAPNGAKKDTLADLLKSYQGGASYASYGEGDRQVRHGDFVSITPKGSTTTITGVFVYRDPKSGKMYIRRRAGEAPVAVQIRDEDKVVPAVDKTDKGGVRPAIEIDERPSAAAPAGYEIHVMKVHNGPRTTSYFFETSLSPGEREQLGQLERAADDVQQKSGLVDSLTRAVENSANEPPTTVVQTGGAGYGYGYPYYAYPYYYPVEYYNPYYYAYNPVYGSLAANYGYYYGPGFGYGYGGGGSGANTTVVVQNTGNGANPANLMKSLSDAQAALTAAQKTLAVASSRAVYDPNGRIVAVRLEE